MTFVDSSPDNIDSHKPLIRVVDLVTSFGDTTILQGITLDVFPGETMVVMGGSGCGKTTLLRHMIGTLHPDEGHVELFGKDLAGLSRARLNALRRRFGVLYQSGALFSSMTVGQNVALPLEEHTHLSRAAIEAKVVEKLAKVGMTDAIDLMPAELSGGMRKRAGLARAIAMDPEILFYDEPSAGLDPVMAAQITQMIRDLDRELGVTSVVVTHDMTLAFRVADRMAVMASGRMLKIGPASEFAAIRDSAVPPPDEASAMIHHFLRGQPVTGSPGAGIHFPGTVPGASTGPGRRTPS
ncbi:MAG: ABC transporter ATP-binding protein [Planctomycetota bacterium]|nr:ABC transporter ATP-binding protein [Planctomycetota bacterium]